MDIKIYQINSDRDQNRICYLGTESLEKFQGSAEINSAIYDKVYEGSVDCRNLEEVYEMFNLRQPPEFCGHSLSVSDVVQVVESDTAKKGFFFCDIIAGPCFICDCSGESFGSLSEEQLKRYQEKFKLPEHFSKQNDEIVAFALYQSRNNRRGQANGSADLPQKL